MSINENIHEMNVEIIIAKFMKKVNQNHFPECILKEYSLPNPVPEYRFCETRKWRADYAWVDVKLIVEIEGGVWSHGRHINPIGYIKDMEKYNAMVELGWHKLSYQPKRIDYEQIKRVYEKLKNDDK